MPQFAMLTILQKSTAVTNTLPASFICKIHARYLLYLINVF